MVRKSQPDLFANAPVDYRKPIRAARTAMHRKTPSPIARALERVNLFKKHGIKTVLDYGCGVGRDVEFYSGLGLDANGYDPHPPFGWATVPTRAFDLVVNLFVFNVVAAVSDRLLLAESLKKCVRPGGILIVAARSPATIVAEATKKNWHPFGDGYLSSPSRGTFQKGISKSELLTYLGDAEFEILEVSVPVTSDVTCISLRRLPTGIE